MGTKEAKENKEKPLDRMTVKELREVALQIPEITGVHGMKKEELLSAIKEAQGIAEDKTKKSDTPKKAQKTAKDKTEESDAPPKAQKTAEDKTKKSGTSKKTKEVPKDKTKKTDISVTDIKKKIVELKAKKIEALKNKDSNKAKIFRRRISRLKKKTRRAA